jgi:hypothetical protein
MLTAAMETGKVSKHETPVSEFHEINFTPSTADLIEISLDPQTP